MAIRYYDEAIRAKLDRWIPDKRKLRILKPDETKRLFETQADDEKDKKIKLPFIALSRSADIELLLNIKNPYSFDGLTIDRVNADLSGLKGQAYKNAVDNLPTQTAKLNAIPIKVQYQLDIYTKTFEQGDEYLRNFLFKLINNPVIKITIPYNDMEIEQKANLRVLSTVSDSSAISERLFSGQFTRWTIQLELQDGFLYSIPYRHNWKITNETDNSDGWQFEVSEDILEEGEIEMKGSFKKG